MLMLCYAEWHEDKDSGSANEINQIKDGESGETLKCL